MTDAAPLPDAVPPITRPNLHDEVVTALRRMILDGELPADARVPERELALAFRVSRTPLREALKVLAGEGLVVLEPNRGCRVARLTAAEAEELFEVMAPLERLSGALACANAGAADLAALDDLLARMAACREAGDGAALSRLGEAIRRRIVGLAGNAVLDGLHASLSARLRRACAHGQGSGPENGEADAAVSGHARLVEALRRGDGIELGALLEQGLLARRDAVLAALGAVPPAAPQP